MIAWWNSRQPRERNVLIIGAALAVVAVGYTFVWEPLQRNIERNRAAASEQLRTHAWMEAASNEIMELRAAPRSAALEGSLLAAMERSAKAAGLGQYITRMEPSGTDAIRLQLTNVVFDRLIAWLASLQTDYGVTVSESTISATSTTGYVDASLTLSR